MASPLGIPAAADLTREHQPHLIFIPTGQERFSPLSSTSCTHKARRRRPRRGRQRHHRDRGSRPQYPVLSFGVQPQPRTAHRSGYRFALDQQLLAGVRPGRRQRTSPPASWRSCWTASAPASAMSPSARGSRRPTAPLLHLERAAPLRHGAPPPVGGLRAAPPVPGRDERDVRREHEGAPLPPSRTPARRPRWRTCCGFRRPPDRPERNAIRRARTRAATWKLRSKAMVLLEPS